MASQHRCFDVLAAAGMEVAGLLAETSTAGYALHVAKSELQTAELI